MTQFKHVQRTKSHSLMEPRVFSLLQSRLNSKTIKQIYAVFLKQQLDPTFLFSNLASNPSIINYAHHLFDVIPQPDSNLFSSLISSYSMLSLHGQVIKTFFSACKRNLSIPFGAIPPVLKACASENAKYEGKRIHCYVFLHGFHSNVYIQTSLIDFYAKNGEIIYARKVFDETIERNPIPTNCLITAYSKCGNIIEARKLFDEMPQRTSASWNSIIAGYANLGDYKEALKLFNSMQNENFKPNSITFVTVLSLCAKLADLETGLRVRDLIVNNNLKKDIFVKTALLGMYVKCGLVNEARKEFDSIKNKDVFAWSSMISGYSQNGRANEALELFKSMILQNCQPNEVTLVSVLSACAQIGSVEIGEKIGKYVENYKYKYNVHVGSALVDMYAKCGNIKKACKVFDEMPERDAITWNSMIRSLALNGFAKGAINLFNLMKQQNFKPTDITFNAVLTACTHAGLVDLGLEIFKSIETEYKIEQNVEHFACIVDLYCKAGRVNEAYKFILQMKIEPNAIIWGSLLSACRVCKNVELAEISAKKLFKLEPGNSSNYVVLSNIYADAGKWDKAREIRDLMKSKKVEKLKAYSWIELDGETHKFLVGDSNHIKCDEIYDVADLLGLHLEWDNFDHNFELEPL